MSNIKIGSLCWVNSRCSVPENVGVVVEVKGLYGIIDGVNEWHIHSKTPLLCYHPVFSGSKWTQCCGIPEPYLTLINDGELVDEEVKDDATVL